MPAADGTFEALFPSKSDRDSSATPLIRLELRRPSRFFERSSGTTSCPACNGDTEGISGNVCMKWAGSSDISDWNASQAD